MTRIKISIGIIAALICTAIFFSYSLNSGCDRLFEIIARLESYKAVDDMDSAYTETEHLLREWDSFYKKANLIIRNDKLIDAEHTISRIRSLTESDNDELGADLSELKSCITHIKNSETPYIYNVL